MPKAKQFKFSDFLTPDKGIKHFRPTIKMTRKLNIWKNQCIIAQYEKEKAAAIAAAALQAQIPNDTEDGFGDFGNYDFWTPNNDSPTPTRNEQSPANSDDEGDLLLFICL